MSLYRTAFGVLAPSVSLGVLAAKSGVDLRVAAATLGAAYDWGGESLPDVGAATGNWVCSRTGTVAAATGAPTVTTLNGRKAALFSGAQEFITPAFSAQIPQPLAIVFVAASDITTTGDRRILRTTEFIYYLYRETGVSLAVFNAGAFTSVNSPPFVNATPYVGVALYNGTESNLRLNGVQSINRSPGTGGMANAQIGLQWIGTIARVSLFAVRPEAGDAAAQLADLIARSSAFAAACQAHYGIA
jgi:hypothetical protein